MKNKKKKNHVLLAATRWALPDGARDSKSFLLSTGGDTTKPVAAPSVLQESQRTKIYEELKKQLRDECTSQGQSQYPSMAFERWWLSVRDHTGGPDPLIPTPQKAEDPTLVTDLERAGFSRTAACGVARRLASKSAASAASLAASKESKQGSKEIVELQRSSDGDEVQLFCKSAGARVRFSAFAYKKLKKLYEFHQRRNGCSRLEEAAVVLGLRYQALGGTGFQLALPAAAWNVLQTDFAVQAECFASPFNCWFPNYCSAFPDCARPSAWHSRESRPVFPFEASCHFV
ncbi:Pcif1 [Symbiodinium natans]|uniref:Pcif1 protein n=1 Tax=Symbiodinium natans TaxID=878477 RepID=A0A812NGT3_9DINO|nr:Pcif1 [Symbiodinium natans]